LRIKTGFFEGRGVKNFLNMDNELSRRVGWGFLLSSLFFAYGAIWNGIPVIQGMLQGSCALFSIRLQFAISLFISYVLLENGIIYLKRTAKTAEK
jgi:hypothetical protein